MRTYRQNHLLMLAAGALMSLGACADLGSDAAADDARGVDVNNGFFTHNGIFTHNNMAVISGLVSGMGLTGANGSININGLSLTRGLMDSDGLSSSSALMNTDAGRRTVAYLVRCALASNDTIMKTDGRGTTYPFDGALGLCPQWKTSGIATDRACQNTISACMMAFVNTAGVQVPIWLDSENPNIGWGRSPVYSLQEGTFFGNIMMTGGLDALGMPGVVAPKGYYCGGAGTLLAAVAGRLSGSATDTPFVTPYGPTLISCANLASLGLAVPGPTVPTSGPPDGYKVACVAGSNCFQNGEPITVWRIPTYKPGFDTFYRYVVSPTHVAGKAIDVPAGATANGTLVQQYLATGSDAQKFAILKSGTSSNWQISMKNNTSKCIGPVGNGAGNGTRIEIQDCRGSNNQAWMITALAASGAFTFRNIAANRCLEVAGGSAADGTPLQLVDCNSNSLSQQFKVAASY